MEYLRTICFIILVKMVDCAYRKIKDGKIIDESMRYMVYLLKMEKSEMLYDTWLCGGAIVSPDFIVTSAACVKDVTYMYAVGSYFKYVKVKDIANHTCTRLSKKKIVYTCVPRGYDLDYARVEKWSYIDIAVAQVESPYDFSGPKLPGCSWVPNKIKINFDKKYQSPKTDAMVLGWGHAEKWRQPGDTTDYNQKELRYSSIQIMNKIDCKKKYRNNPALFPVIDRYMICAMDEGNLDDNGDAIQRANRVLADGCPRGTRRVGDECQPADSPIQYEYQHQDKNPSYDHSAERNAYEYQDGTTDYNPVRIDPNQYQDTQDPVRINQNEYQDTPEPFRINPSQYQDTPNPIKTNQNEYQDTQDPVRTNQNEYQDTPEPSRIYPNEYQDNPDPVRTNENEYQTPSVRTNPYDQHQNQQNDADILTFDDIFSNSRKSDKRENKNHSMDTMGSRKAGICQNDHGGPLVTWVGKHERLIGVASVFQINSSFSCVGPYLFTSTQCNGAFLDCVINGYYRELKKKTTASTKTTEKYKPATTETTKAAKTTEAATTKSAAKTTTAAKTTKTTKTTTAATTTTTATQKKNVVIGSRDDFVLVRRRSLDYCNLPPEEKGFDIIERRLSWKDHPDGPAANEL